MNEPAVPTGDVSQSSANPLAPGALRQLFFSPSAYFRSVSLDEGPAWLVVAWISGVSSVIDRVDQRLVRADLKGGSSGTGAIEESWYAFCVLAAFPVRPTRALWWFLILPITFYSILLGVLGALLSVADGG